MIKTFSKLVAVGAVVLLSTTLAAHASMLSGDYTNLTMQTFAPLYDITGGYTNEAAELGLIGLTITNEFSGKCTGSGMVYIEDVGGHAIDLLSTNLVVIGEVKGPSTKPSLSEKLDYSTSGTAEDGVVFKSLKATFDGKFILDTTNDELVGSGTATAKSVYVEDGKDKNKTISGKLKDIVFPITSDTFGDWALVLSLTDESDTKYSDSSTAEIVTAHGTEIDFSVTGTYSIKTDESHLELKGPKGSDCSLTLEITGDELTIDSIHGKVLGQTLSVKTEAKD